MQTVPYMLDPCAHCVEHEQCLLCNKQSDMQACRREWHATKRIGNGSKIPNKNVQTYASNDIRRVSRKVPERTTI